jgi:F420-dependent oxidoreductase-like protein
MTRRFSFAICTDQNMPWHTTLERWQLFERLGFESAWLCDHLLQPTNPQEPYFEAWTLLAALAARTERIRIGILVSSNTFRHPAVLAKQAVTVDHIANGRLEVGLGAGWYEPEHAMFGIPFPERRELVDRFHEAVQVIDRLLREDTTSFEGEHYRLDGARSRPPAIQRPRPPLVIGAKGPRMLRIAATYADTWNASGTPQEMKERNRLLDRFCTEIGRDPRTLGRSLYFWVPRSTTDPWASRDAFRDAIERYVEVGVDQFILDQPPEAKLRMLEWVASEMVPSFAGRGLPS